MACAAGRSLVSKHGDWSRSCPEPGLNTLFIQEDDPGGNMVVHLCDAHLDDLGGRMQLDEINPDLN